MVDKLLVEILLSLGIFPRDKILVDGKIICSPYIVFPFIRTIRGSVLAVEIMIKNNAWMLYDSIKKACPEY